MSNTVAKKERVSLKYKELGTFIREVEKAVTKDDKYGDSVWFDLVTWSDGSKSLGGYDSETKKRYNLGKVFPPREQDDKTSGAFETTTETKTVADDLPF